MKKLFLTIVLLISITTLFAQSPISKGKSQLNAGFGFSSWGIPVYVGLDYGVHKDITVGGEVSFHSFKEDWGSNSYSFSIIGISGNANYHFNELLDVSKEWDFYAGINLGFYIWSAPSGYGGSHSSGLGLGGQLGARYYINDRFGINLEFGGGNAASGGKIGISYKL